MRKIAVIIAALMVLAVTQAASAADIPASVQVPECLLGITAETTSMDFTSLFPGEVSTPVLRNLTVSGTIGGTCITTIAVSFNGTNWTGTTPPNTMLSTQTNVTVDSGTPLNIPLVDTPYGPFAIGIHAMNFQLAIPDPQAADTYAQTVTVTGIY